MAKWCWHWPYCACGVDQAARLEGGGINVMVWRDDVGKIRRVPTSELRTYGMIEDVDLETYTAGCPKMRGEPKESRKRDEGEAV